MLSRHLRFVRVTIVVICDEQRMTSYDSSPPEQRQGHTDKRQDTFRNAKSTRANVMKQVCEEYIRIASKV